MFGWLPSAWKRRSLSVEWPLPAGILKSQIFVSLWPDEDEDMPVSREHKHSERSILEGTKASLPPLSGPSSYIVEAYQLIPSVDPSHVLLVIREQRKAWYIHVRPILITTPDGTWFCGLCLMHGTDRVDKLPIKLSYFQKRSVGSIIIIPSVLLFLLEI